MIRPIHVCNGSGSRRSRDMRPAIIFPRLPDAAMEHQRRLAPPDRNGVDTETTISSTISTNSFSSSAAVAVPFTISSIPGLSRLTPTQQYHDHQDHAAFDVFTVFSTHESSSASTTTNYKRRPPIRPASRPPSALGRSYLCFSVFDSAV